MEFQPGSAGVTPLFVVAAPGVHSLGYALLARSLGQNQPFYKLQAQGPIALNRPLTSEEIRTLATQCVAGMRAVQPQGPYYLAAMCVGCHIAEQMILQLESQGQTVALFAVFDTWVQEHTRRRWVSRLYSNYQRLVRLRQTSLREKVEWVRQALHFRARIWTGKTERMQSWDRAYWPQGFKPPCFQAPIVLFKRPKQPYLYVEDPLLGWGPRSESGIRTFEVDSKHHEVLREPHVQFVSQLLLEHMALNTSRSVEAVPDMAVVPAESEVATHQ